MADPRAPEPATGTGWEEDRRLKLTKGLAATPSQRLAWLEEAIALAHRTGALPRKRPPEARGPRR